MDQIGSSSWSKSLSDATRHPLQTMIQNCESWIEKNAGICHLTGNGAVNRFEWAQKILLYDPKPEERRYSGLQKTTSISLISQRRALKLSHWIVCGINQFSMHSILIGKFP
jgi:dTDP-4-dehydrorhamnose reductase